MHLEPRPSVPTWPLQSPKEHSAEFVLGWSVWVAVCLPMVSAEWVRYQYVEEYFEQQLVHLEHATGGAHNVHVYPHHRNLCHDTVYVGGYYCCERLPSIRRNRVCFPGILIRHGQPLSSIPRRSFELGLPLSFGTNLLVAARCPISASRPCVPSCSACAHEPFFRDPCRCSRTSGAFR